MSTIGTVSAEDMYGSANIKVFFVMSYLCFNVISIVDKFIVTSDDSDQLIFQIFGIINWYKGKKMPGNKFISFLFMNLFFLYCLFIMGMLLYIFQGEMI